MACSACMKHKFPPKLQMLKSLAKAGGNAIKAYVNGEPMLSLPQMFNKRTMICKNCPTNQYVIESGRCLKCGCFIRLKAALAKESCPDKHW